MRAAGSQLEFPEATASLGTGGEIRGVSQDGGSSSRKDRRDFRHSDALTTPRADKEACDAQTTIEHIIDRSSTHFDPACVEAFRALRTILSIMATSRMTGSFAPSHELASPVMLSNYEQESEMRDVKLAAELAEVLALLSQQVKSIGQRVIALQTVNSLLLSEVCALTPRPEETLHKIAARLAGTAMGVAEGLRRDPKHPGTEGMEITEVVEFVTRIAEANLAEGMASADTAFVRG
jgi:hypothetical protein